MKPKSFDSGYESIDKRKQNCTIVDMHNIASEAASSAEMSTNSDIVDKQHREVKSESPKREKTRNKRKKKGKKEKSDNIAFDNSIEVSTPQNETQVTSTPLGTYKNSSAVKSIMKNMSAIAMDNTIDSPQLDISAKPKKRNKSVSFMLEDNVEVVIKKTKSNDCGTEIKSNVSPNSKVKRQFKKVKKNRRAEKENTIEMEDVQNPTIKKANKKSINHETSEPVIETPSEAPLGEDQISQNEIISENKKKKKRVKTIKKTIKDTEVADSDTVENIIKEVPDKTKKPKKKKHQEKPDSDEPVTKSRKKDSKPDVIAADLENLSIGDNAHTLTNLLDEMTVVDKEKRKKIKQKFKKNDIHSATKQESDKIDNGVEKIKWSRRKWNKDTKADANDTSLETTVIVENLPLSLLFNYKKMLNDHFVKYGLIKNVGIAEVYSTETSKPVFTTTINFYSDGAATKALQEDNTLLEGNCIRVKKSLPLTETTIVVRSYGILTTQFLSSIFVNAGRIRNIRHLVKGKNTMVSVFIEFDGPEAVEKAINLATNLKAGGKKIYASRYEIRAKKNKQVKTNDNDASDADQSEN